MGHPQNSAISAQEARMKRDISVLLVVAGLILMAALAQGHHGWAAFDPQSSVVLQGTVTDFHFVNPHSVVDFAVKDEKGQLQNWQGELTSAANLAPKGWTATSLEAGDEITVSGARARTGVRVLRILKIVTKKGKELKAVEGE
jgi:hypothetical protein